MYVLDPGKLRARRVEAGLSQQELAEGVCCTQQYISALERGKRDCSAVIARRICRWLDADLEDYFNAEPLSFVA